MKEIKALIERAIRIKELIFNYENLLKECVKGDKSVIQLSLTAIDNNEKSKKEYIFDEYGFIKNEFLPENMRKESPISNGFKFLYSSTNDNNPEETNKDKRINIPIKEKTLVVILQITLDQLKNDLKEVELTLKSKGLKKLN